MLVDGYEYLVMSCPFLYQDSFIGKSPLFTWQIAEYRSPCVRVGKANGSRAGWPETKQKDK